MHFNTGLVAFLVASVALAGPKLYTSSTLAERQISLCKVGVPCFVQGQVDIGLKAINDSIANDEVPINTIIANVNACASVLAQVAAELPDDIAAVSADAQAQLTADINGAIATAMADINGGLRVIVKAQTTVAPQLDVAVASVKSAMAGIVAVVGPCF